MSRTKVSVLGAHTILAKAVAESVDDRGLDVELLRFTTLEEIDQESRPLGPEAFAGVELCVVAAAAIGTEVRDAYVQRGVPVLELSGDLEGTTRLWPDLDRDVGERLQSARRFSIAQGLAPSIVNAVHCLSALSPSSASVVTMEGAGGAGQPGLDALSAQIRQLFNMQEVDDSVFGGQLAFNVLPRPEDGLPADVAAGLSNVEVSATRFMVPTFTGSLAWVSVAVEESVPRDILETHIDSARGVVLKTAPSALDAVDREDALVGIASHEARAICLTVAADIVMARAGAAARVIEQWLDKRSS